MVKIQVNSQGKAYLTSGGKVLAASESGNGSSASTGKYQLLDRISDDNGNEVGTVSGFFTDGDNVEYAVVCLDARYRLYTGMWTSSAGEVTDLPIYSDLAVWSATETATFNTQKILDWCEANSYTSTSCTHCRSKSFTIENITYYGQLPNLVEVVDIFKNRIKINDKDPTATTNPVPVAFRTLTSSQYGSNSSWVLTYYGKADTTSKTIDSFVIPILEIPNTNTNSGGV